MAKQVTSFTPKNATKYWRECEDEFLTALADNYENLTEAPDEEELIELLTYLFVFSMGLREMKLYKLSETFEKRATRVGMGISKMGYTAGRKYKNHVLNRKMDGFYDRVMKKACFRSAYRMIDLVRTTKEEKLEDIK